jgi:hemerythrin superfamily protein
LAPAPERVGSGNEEMLVLRQKEGPNAKRHRLLKHDHREVEQLFSKFESSHDAAIVEKICSELEVHTAAEEKLVYPVLREDVSDGGKLADEAEHEHPDARQIIGRKQATDGQHLNDLVAELKEAIEHHVEEEERPADQTEARGARTHAKAADPTNGRSTEHCARTGHGPPSART